MLIKKISNIPSIKSCSLKLVCTTRGYTGLMKKQDISTINSTFIISKIMSRRKKIWSYVTSTRDLQHSDYRLSPGQYNNAVHIMMGSWNVPFPNCTNTCLQLCSGKILYCKPVVFYCTYKGE